MAHRLLFWLTAVFLLPFAAWGQAYEPGYVVRANGDTLRGEIENGFWVEPPTFIRFRPAPDGPSQLFRPRQLRAVSFTGGRYFSYEALPIDHAAKTKLHELPRGNCFDVHIDTVLAEVLLNGSMPLRRVMKNGTAHYLVRGANKPILNLSARNYLRQSPNGSWVVTDGNNYRNQLTLYFNDCPEARAMALAAPFTTEGIIGVVQAFNQACSPARQTTRSWLAQAKPRRQVSFQGGLVAGVRYNRIESTSYPLQGPCADCQPHPFAGLYAELLQPSRTVALYGEIGFSPFNNTFPIFTGFNAQTGVATFALEDYQGLLGTARLGARYFFPLPNENQLLLLGFDYELNKVMQTSVATGNGRFEQSPDFGFQTLLPGLEIGWRSRRLTFALNGKMYINSTGSDTIDMFFGSNYVVRTGLSYRLGGNPDALKTGKPTGR